MEPDSGTKQAGKAELVFTCLLCQRPLSAKDMELGFAMCWACRDYYCPEPGPAMEIIHTPKGPKLEPLTPARLEHRGSSPKRLAVIKTPALWIPMGGCFGVY